MIKDPGNCAKESNLLKGPLAQRGWQGHTRSERLVVGF